MHNFHCDKDYNAKTVMANVKYPTDSCTKNEQPYALVLDQSVTDKKALCCKYYDLNAFRPDIRCESLLLREIRKNTSAEVIVLYESKSCTDRESMIPKHIIYKHEIFSSVR
jgi:hypothetical protein